MNNFIGIVKVFAFLAFMFCLNACGSNASNNNNSNGKSPENNAGAQQEQRKAVSISGVYSGTDNVGMQSTIILRNTGTLIIEASVGDGTPDYGYWSGTADNLSLYHKDAFGNDELIGNAKVTEEGLTIIGGNFYPRQ